MSLNHARPVTFRHLNVGGFPPHPPQNLLGVETRARPVTGRHFNYGRLPPPPPEEMLAVGGKAEPTSEKECPPGGCGCILCQKIHI